MADHWQVIEDALLEQRASNEKYMTGWQPKSAVYKRYEPELERIDAALAFVREMRQGQWMRIIDKGVGEPIMTFDIDEETSHE